MNKIIVIGGGPAGMFAAIAAAETGSQVILLEKTFHYRKGTMQYYQCGRYG